jgi:hypothetical protein
MRESLLRVQIPRGFLTHAAQQEQEIVKQQSVTWAGQLFFRWQLADEILHVPVMKLAPSR